ncbi:MAG: cell division protein ZapD, partial [Lysobacterales bacterium]
MPHNRSVYEQPLSERIRTFLRLEHLFAKAQHALTSIDPWSSRATLEAVIDIMAVISRADLKKEMIKELERHAATL